MSKVVVSGAALCLAIALAVAHASPAETAAKPPGEAAFQFVLAKALVEDGSYGEAEQAFARATQLEPSDPYLRIEYGQFLANMARGQRSPLARQSQLEKAAREVDAARRLAPDNLDVLRAVSSVYLRLDEVGHASGALDVARKALEQVRVGEPSDLQSMVTLGQIYLRQNQPAKAAEVFAQVADYIPTNRAVFNMLYDARRSAGQTREAEQALKRLVELDPDSAEERLELARLQSQRGDHEAALATLEALSPEARRAPEVKGQLARELVLVGKPKEADHLADEILAVHPDDPGTLYLKVWILAAEKRYDEADATVSQLASLSGATSVAEGARLALAARLEDDSQWQRLVTTLAPLVASAHGENLEDALVGTAGALVHLDRRGEALDLLAKHRDAGPKVAGETAEILLEGKDEKKAKKLLEETAGEKDPRAAVEVVKAFFRSERFRDPLPVLEALSDAHPDALDILFLLGSGRERTGDTHGAAAAFESLLERRPDDAETLNYLGYMWAEHGENLERARDLLEKAVDLQPDNGAFVDSLGWVHFQLQEYDKARSYLERAVELEPGDSTVLEHLGDVYSVLGDRAKAADLYRRALEAGDANAEQVKRKLLDLGAH